MACSFSCLFFLLGIAGYDMVLFGRGNIGFFDDEPSAKGATSKYKGRQKTCERLDYQDTSTCTYHTGIPKLPSFSISPKKKNLRSGFPTNYVLLSKAELVLKAAKVLSCSKRPY